MDFDEFNDKYVNKSLYKITKENKTTFLIVDFNMKITVRNHKKDNLVTKIRQNYASILVLSFL